MSTGFFLRSVRMPTITGMAISTRPPQIPATPYHAGVAPLDVVPINSLVYVPSPAAVSTPPKHTNSPGQPHNNAVATVKMIAVVRFIASPPKNELPRVELCWPLPTARDSHPARHRPMEIVIPTRRIRYGRFISECRTVQRGGTQ